MFNIEDYREYITPDTAVYMIADLVAAATTDEEPDKALLDEIRWYRENLIDNIGPDADRLVLERFELISGPDEEWIDRRGFYTHLAEEMDKEEAK